MELSTSSFCLASLVKKKNRKNNPIIFVVTFGQVLGIPVSCLLFLKKVKSTHSTLSQIRRALFNKIRLKKMRKPHSIIHEWRQTHTRHVTQRIDGKIFSGTKSNEVCFRYCKSTLFVDWVHAMTPQYSVQVFSRSLMENLIGYHDDFPRRLVCERVEFLHSANTQVYRYKSLTM